MRRIPSEAQRELLFLLSRYNKPVEWGDIWDVHTWSAAINPTLAMRNFDRASDACLRRGWIEMVDDGTRVVITSAGRHALKGES